MLGSLSECLARAMASSVTRVSPLAWISSTAIWGTEPGQAWGRDHTGEPGRAQLGGGQSTRWRAGAVPPVHTSQRRRCPQRSRRPPLNRREHRTGRREAHRAGTGRPDPAPLTAVLWGKKCRFRSSSRSARMGLRRSCGSAVEGAKAEQAGPLQDPIPQSLHLPLEKIRCHTAKGREKERS